MTTLVKEMFNPHFGLFPDAATVKGLLSLGFWSLILVVTVKYVMVIMRADNQGEGGIMSLTALAQNGVRKGSPPQAMRSRGPGGPSRKGPRNPGPARPNPARRR